MPERPGIGHDGRSDIFNRLNTLGIPIRRRDLAYRTDHEPTQHALLRAGAGIAGMQIKLAERERKLVRVLPRLVRIPMEMWLVMHEDLRSTRRVRLLFEHLSDGLRSFTFSPTKRSSKGRSARA